METLTLKIVRLAEVYTAHVDRKMSTISTYASGDGKKFKHFQAGGGCTVQVAERILGWFDRNWPADLAWPEGITRPAKTLADSSTRPPRGSRRAA